MTRGLEMMRPVPSSSSADNSRFRKRLALALKSDSANVAAPARVLLTAPAFASKLTNCESDSGIGGLSHRPASSWVETAL